MSSAAIAIRAPRVALRTIFKVKAIYRVETRFQRKKMTVNKVGYEESATPRSGVRGSTVHKYVNLSCTAVLCLHLH